MTSEITTTAPGEKVLAALKILDAAGTEGFAAARRAHEELIDHLRDKVLAILGPEKTLSRPPEIPEVPTAPGFPQESARQSSGAASEPERNLVSKLGDIHRVVAPAAGVERKSTTKKLAESYGSKAVTHMTYLVILQHLLTQPREASVRTIFEELTKAHLMGPDQRGSLVTSLNRLKKTKKFITWPEGKRGEEIKLTREGESYLRELKERKLQAAELEYLKKNASASISENLP